MRILLLLSALMIQITLFSQTWETAADIPTGRHHPVTFALDGMGYSATGTNASNQPTKDFYQYNPVTNTWSTLTPFPGLARSYSIGVTQNGLAYLGFGSSNTQFFNDLWQFNPQNQQWTQLASCPCTARRHPALIALNNKIYLGLGNNALGDLKDWWEYNTDTDSWSQMTDLPGPARHHPFQFTAGGEVFAGLGHGGPIVYKDWYKLDTTTNSWTAQLQFPGEARVAGTQFDNADYGYVLSGDGDNHNYMATGEFWRYDAGMDYWIQLTPHPGVSRWAPGSFVIGDVVYFFGGVNRQANQLPNDMWKFDIAAASVGLIKNDISNVRIHPNPATEFVRWAANENISHVSVLNTLGEIVHSTIAADTEIDISTWKAGMYFVQFYDRNELVKTEKLVVR